MRDSALQLRLELCNQCSFLALKGSALNRKHPFKAKLWQETHACGSEAEGQLWRTPTGSSNVQCSASASTHQLALPVAP